MNPPSTPNTEQIVRQVAGHNPLNTPNNSNNPNNPNALLPTGGAATSRADVAALAYVLQFRRSKSDKSGKSGEYIAFAPYVSQEFIECPSILAMPTAAPYGYGLIEWRQRLIPLIDFDALIYARESTRTPPPFALVLAYRSGNGQIAYGAIATDSVPDSLYVRDSDLCALPINSSLWQTLASSCIAYRGIAAPIINTDALFGRAHIRRHTP